MNLSWYVFIWSCILHFQQFVITRLLLIFFLNDEISICMFWTVVSYSPTSFFISWENVFNELASVTSFFISCKSSVFTCLGQQLISISIKILYEFLHVHFLLLYNSQIISDLLSFRSFLYILRFLLFLLIILLVLGPSTLTCA